MADATDIRAFLDDELRRVVEECKKKTTDDELIAGALVSALVKNGLRLAKACGLPRLVLESALRTFVEEEYR